MPRQIIARLLLVCAVLLAQQTALAHDLWHASAQAGTAQPKSADGKKLCDLHDLLGTVLAAVGGAAPQAELLSFSDIRFSGERSVPVWNRRVAAHSRGPPAPS